ncbi:pyridoxamine 5'-phosphate oxidase [Simiduia sp. 21SJ11W-1]|uniref:pyridoxamine 5'-phosphate oxidase n=1 Tax=Simiduia sp. 21SJ11W-1 TaxID=2909669 RepID=UPI00209DCD99|nr:pyridoxamine 5'-phosphate oxidase [Simiduia sp. 21SJ11W-1]UTA49630.1 pyridoxamine 5'-phosphate oxidase [Simiduia sp. 21SJ11W-1]
MNLEDLRRDYLMGGLDHSDLNDDPIAQFEVWLQQAIDLQLKDPTAMTVATVDASGQPSQRIVLLKKVDHGFVFYTNYGSRKAQELSANPKVSLHFPWHDIERQVKICGVAEKVSAAESAKYFLSRPKESQLAAWASHQSHPVATRQLLMQQVARMKEKFAAGLVPAPDFWGGYRVVPSEIEFWQGGANRLHDRFQYTRTQGGWQRKRLAP